MVFPQKKTPVEVGLELSKRLKKSIENIPNAVSSIENAEFLHLDDADDEKLYKELTILVYVGQRLALQVASTKIDSKSSKMREICDALDSYALDFLDNSPEFEALLYQRGELYFELLSSHFDTIKHGDWKEFIEALQFKFEQLCRGGGGENDPVIIGDFYSMMPLRILASHFWLEGFVETFKYVTQFK